MAQFTEYVYQNQVGHHVSLVGKFVHDLSTKEDWKIKKHALNRKNHPRLIG